MNTRSTEYNPHGIFVVGCPRSGTTLLQGLMGTSPQTITFTESHFFDWGIRKPRCTGFYYLNREIVNFVEKFVEDNNLSLKKQREIQEAQPKVPVFPGSGLREWINYLIGIFDHLAMEARVPVWIEKTPDHLNRIDLIERFYPIGRYVHIVRNGGDVVASLYKASVAWGKNFTIDQCIKFWNRAIGKTYRRIQAGKDVLVTYEYLVRRPEKVINEINTQMGLQLHDGILESYHRQVERVIAPGESWKKNNPLEIHKRSTFGKVFSHAQQQYVSSRIDSKTYSLLLASNNHVGQDY